ncbi:restriction endonuclease subunit S [Microbacterium aurum]
MTRALRDSGVGWLGMTPDDWPVLPARALFGERKQKSNAVDVHLTPSQKYGVLPQAEYMEITGNKVVLNLSGADNMRHVEAGDYISHLRSFQGGLEFAGMPGKVSAAYTVLKSKLPLEPRFFKYLFKSDLYIQALQTTTDQLRDGQSIRYGQFTLIPLPYPALDEQRAIADYLDRETAQIDAFIAKNEELITLLTERRTAVIAQAVLRGLDAAASLRDSGVEWLGAVPSHWRVSRLSRWFRVTLGKMLDEAKFASTVGDVLPYVRASNIKAERLDLSDVKTMPFTMSEQAKFSLRAGDLVVVEGGSIGVNASIPDDMDGWGFQKTVNRVRSRSGDLTRFLGYQLDVIRDAGVLNMIANVSTIQHLTAEKLERLVVAMPPIEEQAAIVSHIGRSISVIDRAIGVAERGVQLARERRGALISAAVTGKIDVGVAA